MKKTIIFITSLLVSYTAIAQYEYDLSEQYPFGKANPNAPEQINDYEAMIGECNCISTRRNQEGTWTEPIDIIWRWKYILNGMAVQDETLKSDGAHSGSIRQYNPDSSKWYVHWFSSATPSSKFPVWEGNKTDEGNIVLYKEQAAPNGTEGFYRLTFHDIGQLGYKWIGEWVDKGETVVFPTWKIECTREVD